MQEELKCGDRVEVLPEFSGFYDELVGRQGAITGLAASLVVVGQMYIVDFGEMISEEFPWTSCCVAGRFLNRVG